MFISVFLAGLFLIALQGFCAYSDGFFIPSQLPHNGRTHAFSLIEHGGWWADIFIIAPLTAHLVSGYHLVFASWLGFSSLVISTSATLLAGLFYGRSGNEAYVHDRKTTAAGWIHGLFAMMVIWVCILFFFKQPAPHAKDLVRIGVVLSVFLPLGTVKFNRAWRFKLADAVQVGVLSVLMWAVIAIRVF